jgi:hypothetical protein
MLFIGVMIAIGLAHWLVYTALLWMMIKLQKMNYNLLGLLGSSLLASACDYIPIVGCYLGWAVLVICLWKCTGADIAPDVLFTVGVAGALMFCVNLFVIGWLMGNLSMISPSLADYGPGDKTEMSAGMDGDEEDEDGETNRVATVAAAAPAPKPASKFGGWFRPSAPAPVATTVTNSAPKDIGNLPTQLTIKGISVSPSHKSAMIANGRQIHDVRVGDSFAVNSDKGRVTLVCEDITQSAVILAADGTRMKLTLR